MKHLTLEQLECFRSETTTLFTRRKIKKHLDQCTACSDKLRELEDAEQITGELKQAVEAFSTSKLNGNDQTYLNLSKVIGQPQPGTSTE